MGKHWELGWLYTSLEMSHPSPSPFHGAPHEVGWYIKSKIFPKTFVGNLIDQSSRNIEIQLSNDWPSTFPPQEVRDSGCCCYCWCCRCCHHILAYSIAASILHLLLLLLLSLLINVVVVVVLYVRCFYCRRCCRRFCWFCCFCWLVVSCCCCRCCCRCCHSSQCVLKVK